MVQQTKIHENCPEQAKLVRDNFRGFSALTGDRSDAQSVIHDPSAETEEDDDESGIDTGAHGRFCNRRRERGKFVLQEDDGASQDKEEEEADPARAFSAAQHGRL